MPDPKRKLLEAAIDHVARHGVGDLSLRTLAAAIGTSHRMLIYHFGSKEGLLVEVVREVEARQRAVLAGLDLGADRSPFEIAREFWRHLTGEALRHNERLFFELYGQALQGRPGTTEMLDGIIDDWLAPMAELLGRLGVDEADRESHARLGLAVTRGLLLDLVTTGDVEAVTAAMDRFLDRYARGVLT
ncbi:TetR/AcrR family transcriptional regulator [Amycolatopsis sp. NPDC059657]|uniref:TetR/AcrR family transcriptional regulator n=1 Tax=Amycolatopsis sp. NPDC059657 TaxID=3346899 RepID=UPI00366FE716